MTWQRFLFWLLALLMAGLTLPLRGQEKVKRMDSLMTAMAGAERFSGSVLVYQKGKILYEKSVGYRDLEKKQEHTPQSIFQIYSVTKPFTATMVLMLVEQGKLKLEDRLAKFYPAVNGADQITIQHLLSHQSGLFEFTRVQDSIPMSLHRFVQLMEKQPLDFTPGTQWAYCNSGYWFLGLIIEKITGMPYTEAIAQNIFKPLGMRHSGFNYSQLQQGSKSIGYGITESGNLNPAETYAPPGPYAAGDIWSTTGDLLLFHRAMQAQKLIGSGMMNKAYTALANQYGLGWMTDSIAGKRIVKHSGGAAGFRSYLVRIPEDDACIIVLGNTEHDINGLVGKLTELLYDRPVHIPVHRNISSTILKQYEGLYQLDPQLMLEVYEARGRLVVQPSMQPRTFLFTESENRFYVEEIDGFVRFLSDGRKFDTLELYQRGNWHKAPRVSVQWGIVGSATPNGWDGPDVTMAPGAIAGTWEVHDLALAAGEIKFRMNNSWSRNYGLNSSGTLQDNGQNMVVQEGKYDIWLDLRDPARPLFRITRK